MDNILEQYRKHFPGNINFKVNVSAVNNSLPVHLTASNVQQNPEFAKLLTSLTRHMTESGISVTVHKDMTQVSVTDMFQLSCE